MKGDFYLGAWLVQPSLGRMSCDGRTVQVRPKVMDLLVYLASSPGEVISKETLLNEVWHSEAISESALTRTITELRQAVADDADQPRFLETIPKRGYRLIATVQPVVPPEASRPTGRRVPAAVIGMVGLLISGSLAVLVFKADPPEAISGPRVKPLTTWPGQEGQPSFSPDGKQVALVWSGEADDNFDVYVKRIGDDSLVRLTAAPEPDRSPAWSPDGRAVAFVRVSDRGVGVYLVPPTGSGERFVANLRRATTVRPRVLEWCCDGRALVVVDQVSDGGPFHIIRLLVDTGERQPLTSPPPHSYGDIHPAISPDGQTLAFARSLAAGPSDVYLLPMSGGEPRRLTFDDNVITGLTWAEDGGSIVFSSERGAMAGTGSLWRVRVGASTSRPEPEQLRGFGPRASGPVIARQGGLLAYQEYFQNTNLWRVSTTGREPPQLVISSTREQNFPDYSADGRIAFASNRSGNWETWIAGTDGSPPRKVTSYAGAPAWHPRWSPNGRLLAFDHAAEGNADVYTITPEGSTTRPLTSEPSSEETPSWSRDGLSVYFSSNRSGGFQIWKVATDRPAQPVQVTEGGGMDPRESADGNRVFYTKRTDSALEIWSTGVNGGAETRVLGPIRSRAGWVPDLHGIYFIEPTRGIAYHRFATGDTTPILALRNAPSPFNPGLALSPDGRWLLYAQMDRAGADLMLVENFR